MNKKKIYQKTRHLILSIITLVSAGTEAKNVTEAFNYELVCHDLHRGEMNVDPVVGAYHEYEMDDGYSGQINLIVSDSQVFIYKNNDLVFNDELTSDAIEMIGSSRIKISKTDDEYFSFHLGRTDLILIKHLIKYDEKFKDFAFECPNTPTIGNTEALVENIINVKSSQL
ncbi:hypothetical protein [Photobacterium halotolerans]|uniref:Uncharacterized protein n=1 Tax=Photobacterium halotolerans TaxID=265726 RepID=A0A0F5VEJ6_9GAMM|nr:hypothetical protein [Photobacterium halotolerans]KKD00222.1 hypothetical protein KY46_08060 [Photobacterium halotolerans]